MPIKPRQKFLPDHLRSLFSFYLIQVLVFFFYRIIQYTYNQQISPEKELLTEAFKVGLQFDVTVTAYLLTPLFLVMSFGLMTDRIFERTIKVLFYLFLLCSFLSQLVFAAGIPYFKQFGNYLNQNAFLYASEGKYVGALIFGDKAYWGFLILFALVFLVSTYFFHKGFKSYLRKPKTALSRASKLIIVILSSLLMLLALRGRVTFKSPIHEGLALISDNNFINSLAINPNFPFWKELLTENATASQTPANIQELISRTKKYLSVADTNSGISRTVQRAGVQHNYNVVIVLMESLCLYKMGYYNGLKTYTLFDSIIRESVFFDRFFSSGIHTFNGLFSTLTGYPSIYNEQPLRLYTKQPFRGLSSTLKKQGYSSSFYTTHDQHFDNMGGFLKMSGFDLIVDDASITSGEAINNLGVPDHVLYNEFISRQKTPNTKQPFFAVLLSSSDHGPWDVPEDVPFKPKFDKKEENAAAYADWALFNFIQNAKKETWYDSTIFVILGDHGLSMGHTYQMPLSYHHIPMVVHCPALLKADTISFPAYQPDVGPTLLSVLNIPYTNSGFGQNAFEGPRDFVLFTADDKIGAVTKEDLYYFELLKDHKKFLYHFPGLPDENLYLKKRTYADSLEIKVQAVIETARYFIWQDQSNK